MIRNSQAGITRRAWRQSSTARALPEIDAQVEVSCLESDDTFPALSSMVNVCSDVKCHQLRQVRHGITSGKRPDLADECSGAGTFTSIVTLR